MQREIGSNFWLDPNEYLTDNPIGSPAQFGCYGSDFVWLSTGRSAIRFVVEAIEYNNPGLKKVALLPSFTCNTVYEPFLNKDYEVYYYPVEKDLTTTSDAILQAVKEHDASIVLFHQYFGFNTLDGQLDKLCDTLRKMGKYSIEDCTQCLYSNILRAKSDYTVGSIRKWTGTPDGGFAVCRKGVFHSKPQVADVRLEEAKIDASYAKYHYLFDNEGEKTTMLGLYRHAEHILDQQTRIYAISATSSKVQSNLDVEDLKRKRQGNFTFLRQSIKEPIIPLFDIDTNLEVPLYYPIIVDDRTALQKYLVENAIYAPVVWPKDEKQPKQCEGTEFLYNHLLCIPIDQRYDEDDMSRIVEVINHFYRYL